jgi:hypothetical protein
MAGSLWTTEFFSCSKCALPYSAIREPHATRQSGSFKCEVCGGDVHTWSGNDAYFDWKVAQQDAPVFGKRWA